MLVEIVKAHIGDHEKLAQLNLDLMDAENYDNKLPIEKLIPRMKMFLDTDYDAFWVKYMESVAGYILIKRTVNPIYIRQFYILPEFQRKGIGEKVIDEIKRIYNTNTLDVEVMAWNEAGLNFWKKVGFKLRCYAMRLN
jgi:ribosomal protein S18 acetylase RimI-like enzyme